MQICSRLLLFFWAAVWCLSDRASVIPWLQASGALSPARSPYWRICFLLTWGHSPSVPSGPPPVAVEGPGAAAAIRGWSYHVALLADASC